MSDKGNLDESTRGRYGKTRRRNKMPGLRPRPWNDEKRKKRWDEWQKAREDRMKDLDERRQSWMDRELPNGQTVGEAKAAGDALKARWSGVAGPPSLPGKPLHGQPDRRSRTNTWRTTYGMPPRKRPQRR